ncbi:hypothetical protein Y023_3543 [Burkholderia pseudomallei A79D]|nr:hypothetical protein Y023_3543 [Burkholderia pseudomallei A79D]
MLGFFRTWIKRVCGIPAEQNNATSEIQMATPPNPDPASVPYWQRINLSEGLQYSDRPGFLDELTPAEFEQILPLAIRSFNGHVPRVAEYRHIKLSSGLSTEVAIRMLSFHMYSVHHLQDWNSTGVVEEVEIRSATGACNFCRQYRSGPYLIDESPEVPLRGCTHKMGCRCTLLPKI